jgi:hypothetical protein
MNFISLVIQFISIIAAVITVVFAIQLKDIDNKLMILAVLLLVSTLGSTGIAGTIMFKDIKNPLYHKSLLGNVVVNALLALLLIVFSFKTSVPDDAAVPTNTPTPTAIDNTPTPIPVAFGGAGARGSSRGRSGGGGSKSGGSTSSQTPEEKMKSALTAVRVLSIIVLVLQLVCGGICMTKKLKITSF